MSQKFKANNRFALSLTALAASTLLSGFAMAQDANIERVEVTGSAIKRIEAESSLPVSVITKDEISKLGVTTAQDLLMLIPSSFGGGLVAQNVGSTGNPSTANLRGLGAKYTLVLLNGRRVANFAFGNNPVDLNTIPLSAVERVEVLRDGASSLYGADAVAGVINFILRKDYQGTEVSLDDTRSQGKGGGSRKFNLLTGIGDFKTEGYNLMLSASHEVDDALKAADTKFANSAVIPSLGINKSSPRNGIPNLNFTDTLGNSYTGVNPTRYSGCNTPGFAMTVISAKGCGTDYAQFIDLIPPATHDNVVARGIVKIDSNNQLIAEYSYTKDHVLSTYSPAPYTVTMRYPTTGRFYPSSITIPAGYVVPSTYHLANGQTLAAGTALTSNVSVTPTGSISGTWRTSAGGGRQDITDTNSNRLLLGAKGLLEGWDYDTALVYSQNKGVISFGNGQFSYAALTPLVASGQINVFGNQDATSMAALNSALLTGTEQTATSSSTELDFKASRDIAEWSTGPVGLALGANIRRESLNQVSMPVLATGDQVGGNGPVPGVSGDRKVIGAFAETTMPLRKDTELNLAGRFDNYANGFGTSFNSLTPKASLRYQPMPELLFRTAAGTGYRAPTLYENLRPLTTGNNTNGTYNDPVRCPGGVPVNSVNPVGALQDECGVQLNTATSGSTSLKPETSKQFSFGMVFQPTKELSGSIDYWNVRINNVIQQASEIQVMSNPNQYVNNFYRYNPASFPNGWVDDGNQTGAIKGSTNPNYPLAYINLPYANQGEFFASGLDLNGRYQTNLPELNSTFVANIDGTLMLTHGYAYPGQSSVSDLGVYKDFGVMPRWRHMLTFSLKQGNWTETLTQSYTSGYEDYTNAGNLGTTNYPDSRRVSSNSIWGASVVWKESKNLEFLAGVKNLLNTPPPVSRIDTAFQVGYDAALASPLGRQFRLMAKYTF